MRPFTPDHMLAMFLVVIFPYFAARSYRRFVRLVRTGAPGVRLAEYRTTMLIQWALFGIVLLVWWQSGRPWPLLGLAVPTGGQLLLGVAVTAVGLAFMAWQWVGVRRSGRAGLDGVRAQIERVKDLLPHTDAEYREFQALSVTAGVCEEVLYRGFLIWYVAAFAGVWPAVFLTGLVFGVAHFYQGAGGMLKTGLVGVGAGALYVGSGSLLWPMVLHAALDLQGGAIGRRALGPAGADDRRV